jgi:hypothetical protein
MPRLSKIGAAALAAFGWTGLQSVNASYLVVAGGGGGGGAGGQVGGGGGGAGGLQTGTINLNPALNYTVTIGAGGIGAIGNPVVEATSGSNSIFSIITSSGGGRGGTGSVTGSIRNGANGGSGGGGATDTGTGTATGTGGTGNTPTTSPSQGNNGGTTTGGASSFPAAGGGGSGSVGANNPSGSAAGNGGSGTASSISGTSVTYAGGGGGGARDGTAGTASGGGGAGSNSGNATAGTVNLGGGGGGGGSSGGSYGNGGAGGSGVVIISYPSPQKFGGGIVTVSGSNTIHTFTTSGTLSPLSSLTASYLIVAGGGGGGGAVNDYTVGGGGGAGGLLTSTGVTIDTNSIYVVAVGAGGTGGLFNALGTNGGNSSWSMVSTTALGGGAGGAIASAVAASGGSGGGGGSAPSPAGGAGTSGQGNAGGAGVVHVSGRADEAGGGGGGSGAVGTAGSVSTGGAGGVGTSSSISGTATFYAGGGGGGGSSVAGAGGNGGGGAGVVYNGNGVDGTALTGGGGGGAARNNSAGSQTGGNGGSGVVIISYPGSTQLMAGGTVTVAGGNVIHTFTSSGYLTPLTFVGNSLRFRSSASAYLNRTPSVASNRKTWTWSAWVKRGGLSSNQSLFAVNNNGNDYQEFRFQDSNTLRLILDAAVNNYAVEVPTVVWRDVSAWYHIVLAVDTTQATSTNRVKIYVNGIQQTVSALSGFSFPAQNFDTYVNATLPHAIGNFNYNNSSYFDGYMADINFVDGQALTPNSFGTFNSFGVWQPIVYGGSYGTNGFYLKFNDATSTTTLGLDSSPQGNNWTTNNISVTAGVTYDSMTDVPTLTSTTAANYCVWNPLVTAGGQITCVNGNLQTQIGGFGNNSIATIGVTSGKWYWEVTPTFTNNGAFWYIGVSAQGYALATQPDSDSRQWAYYASNGNKMNGANVSYGASYTTNDIIGVGLDMDAGTLTFYKNGVSQGQAFSNLAGNTIFPSCSFGNTGSVHFVGNFGQQPFVYTAPSGFLPLNTFNL